MESNIHYSVRGKSNEILITIPGHNGAKDVKFSYHIQHIPDSFKLVIFHLRSCTTSKSPKFVNFCLPLNKKIISCIN